MSQIRATFPDGISVILPVYNEEENLCEVLSELAGVLRGMKQPFEILCVNDGSTDGSLGVLEGLAAGALPELRIHSFPENRGQSAAFAFGFRAARFDQVVTMDADGQNVPADIPRLLEALGEADVCCGVRTERKDTWSKRVGSRIGNAVRRRMLGSEVRDTGCSLKLFRRGVLAGLPAWRGMHRFLPDLCQIHHAARIVQIPVSHRPRLKGQSKYSNWGRFLRTVPDLLAVRWMKNRMLGDDENV